MRILCFAYFALLSSVQIESTAHQIYFRVINKFLLLSSDHARHVSLPKVTPGIQNQEQEFCNIMLEEIIRASLDNIYKARYNIYSFVYLLSY